MFDNWFDWLDHSLGAFAKRVLSSLGIGWVSFETLSQLAGQVKDQVTSMWGQIPADMLNILTMTGFATAFGVILAAITYRAAMASFAYLGKLVS